MPTTSSSQPQSTPHAPLASLAAHWHACRGDIPPPLVGASVTLVDDPNPTKARLYLFGGRLVTTRRMMNDLYELNMSTLRWKKLFASSEEEEEDVPDGQMAAGSSSNNVAKPQPRYFHSCNLWEGKLIIFGGMGYVDGNESELCVLNEVVAFNLKTYTWEFDIIPSSTSSNQNTESLLPQARYAHLSSTTVDSLIIIGGQDMANRYVEEINVLDLKQRKWILRQPYEKQRGSYRSLAVEPLWKVEEASTVMQSPISVRQASDGTTEQNAASSSKQNPFLSAQSISTLPTSYRDWTPKGTLKPLPVYVYTNYNFTDVKREMEVVFLDSQDEQEDSPDACTIQIDDQSQAMSGVSLPPGLRFPMGAILGSHMLISGTYLANTSQTFAIWALHLPTMTWNRLDVGPLLSTGSWNRGVLWPLQNRLVVFGHRERDLVADYNHRQTNWDHVLLIELEAWGITQPPVKQMSLASIQMGLQKLASSTVGSYSASMESGIGPLDDEGDPILALGGRGDFEIVCSDGMRLGCDRIILEKRWPWFAAKMREYQRKAKQVAKNGSIPKASKKGSRPSTAGEQLSALLEEDENDTSIARSNLATSADPRITPRELHISEPSPVMLALLTFIYTRCVCTQLQQHPAIVAALLIVSKVYDMKDLEVWAKHTAHVVMSRDLAPRSPGVPPTAGGLGSMGQGSVIGSISMSRRSSLQSSAVGAGTLPPLERHRLAVALYEAATMSGFEALQIRSLRTVMSIAKWVQRSSISSTRSSTTQESSAEVAGMNTQTPTTAAIGGGTGEHAPRSPEGEKAYNPRSGASSIASPSISRKGSIGKSIASEASESGKKPVRVERSLGMSGLDNAQAGDSTPQLSSTSNLSSGTLSKTSTQSSQTSTSTTGQATQSAITSQRRPSTLSTNGNNSSSRPPPSSSANATTGRKRFSIFGRGGSESGGSKAGASNLSPATTLEGHQEEKGRSSNDLPAFSRLQRTNTDGSGQGTPGGGDSVSNHSMSSLNATQGSTGQNSHSSSTGTLVKEEGPTSNVSRLANAFESGSTNSGPRKSSTFGSRFRSVTGQSNSGMSTSKSANSLQEDPIAEAKVITPTLASTKQMSNNNVAAGLPSPALSAGATSSIQTSSSTKTASGSGGTNGGNRKRMDAGQLNPKDIKALHGIFA